MADLKIIAHYNYLPAKVFLFATVLLLPIWGVLAPAILLYGAYQLAINLTSIFYMSSSIVPLVGGALGLMLLPIVGTLLTLAFADNRIIATRSGLYFPAFIIPFLKVKMRRQFPWSSIKRMEIRPHEKESGRATLLIMVDGGGAIKLNASSIAPSEMEQLLIATELWGAESDCDRSLIEYKEQLQSRTDQSSHLSYTTMWEQELERRFASTSFVPLEPGALLQSGRLKLVRQLSFGGLSAVYLCQKDSKKLVVLKEAVVPPGANEEIRAKAGELFEREARLLMKLSHPLIVPVLDYFVENGRNYMLLEYINGQDLRQFVKQHGRQSERKVLQWGKQICEILAYLHSQVPPIVHRDVTPDNLVLREDDSLVLIDFGAANEFVGTATGTLVGKQCFIAPEQFRGKAVVQTDLYALGCTLYFLTVGSDPEALSTSHPGESMKSLFGTSASGERISDEFDRLVADLTAMDLESRIASASEAKERIERLLVASAAQPSYKIT